MPITFSNHALQQIKKRNLQKDLIIDTTTKPDEILPSFRGRKLRRRSMGDKILEVVTKTEGSKITVITAYLLEK